MEEKNEKSSSSSPTQSSSPVKFTAEIPQVRRARNNFRGRLQGEVESVDEYAAVLCNLAVMCDYNLDALNEQICDQFVFGLRSKAIQDHICEKDGYMELAEVIRIAVAGEAFQLWRFGYQQPLSNQEIQRLIGPYLDEETLLTMRQVSNACCSLANEEMGRRQREILQTVRWNPLVNYDDLNEVFGKLALYFPGVREVRDFLRTFSEDWDNTSWPFFGHGIVAFNFNYTYKIKSKKKKSPRRSYVIHKSVMRFLETFGKHILILICRNDEVALPHKEFQRMLSYTPNLRYLWVEGFFEKETKLPEVTSWPKLPFLDSLHYYYNWDASTGSDNMLEHFLSSYSPQLTALDLNTYFVDPSPPQVVRPPLSDVKAVSHPCHESGVEYIPAFGQHTKRTLKRISFDLWACLPSQYIQGEFSAFDFDKHLIESQGMWNLINQSSQSLVQVYLEIGKWDSTDQWMDFVKYFMLPVLHNPDNSLPCIKVRQLVLPSMSLLRAKQVLQVICKKFPNLEHIKFTKGGKVVPFTESYRDFVKNNHQHSRKLTKWVSDLFFKNLESPPPISWDQPSGEVFSQFWKGLGSLQKITVFNDGHGYPSPGEVIYQETRKSRKDTTT